MGLKRWSKIGSISPGWGCILERFCRVGIYSQSQVKKSEALKMILNMCRTVYSSSQKTRHELIRGGPLFHTAGEHFACRMSLSKGFSKFRASFPKLGRTKQGVDIENICHHLFQGQYVKQKGFNVDNLFDRKGIHAGSIMWNKKRFRIKNSCHKRHPFGGHFALKELASHWELREHLS